MILRGLTLHEFTAARRWAHRHPERDPYALHKSRQWAAIAALEQIRIRAGLTERQQTLL